MNKPIRAPKKPFVLEEVTIDELHAAIKAGETTCVDVVRHYLKRVRAFNGTSNLLVTKDGCARPRSARNRARGRTAEVSHTNRQGIGAAARSR
jgi:Asp-tRNA(Asn)/Glu-tRNA(Gln) amidotransferase A subunit family amidase